MAKKEETTLSGLLSRYFDGLVGGRRPLTMVNRGGVKTYVPISAANYFYASVLLCVAVSLPPTTEQFEDTAFILGPGKAYLKAKELYREWAQLGLEEAVRKYCQRMNRMMDRSPELLSKAAMDFCLYQEEVVAKIKSLVAGVRREIWEQSIIE